MEKIAINPNWGLRPKEESKNFFFEKKKQKTFLLMGAGGRGHIPCKGYKKVFAELFSKSDLLLKAQTMNGAESLVHTLLASGIDTVFANPGTSEMHFVAALDRIPGIKCVLCLDETVVTGAADAYYRVTGRPAATLLHCGPGFANGIANLHNARRARSGVVNIVGDQATYHRALDAPLTADTEGLAHAISAFVCLSTTSAEVGQHAARAIEAARQYPGRVATLILPADTAWEEGGVVAKAAPPAPPAASGGGATSTAGPTSVAGSMPAQASGMMRARRRHCWVACSAGSKG